MKTIAERDRYAFQWSQARLIIAAVALFIGGYPPIFFILPIVGLYGVITLLLKLAWLLSGIASAYLLYRWHMSGHKLFGASDAKDRAFFLVSAISGLNLGLTGLLGNNPGMRIMSGTIIFIIVGLLYLYTFWYLQKRWNTAGKKMF